MIRGPTSLHLACHRAAIAQVPAEPIVEICGKGPCRPRRNRAIVPRNDKKPHSVSSEMRLSLSSVCIRDHRNSGHRQETLFPNIPSREGKTSPLGSDVFLPLLSSLSKHTVKRFAPRIRENNCLLRCLRYRVLSVFTAQSQGLQLSGYLVLCRVF